MQVRVDAFDSEELARLWMKQLALDVAAGKVQIADIKQERDRRLMKRPAAAVSGQAPATASKRPAGAGITDPSKLTGAIDEDSDLDQDLESEFSDIPAGLFE